jgi:ribosomal protein S18 acetylase RimI-like enzyme
MAEFYAESGYPFDRAAAADAIREMLDQPGLGRIWLVAQPEVVGYVAVTFGFSLEFLGRDAFIDEFFIRPRFRGAGLGTRVLAALEPECRALDVRALHLEVERENPFAQRLYRRQGYRDNDRRLLSKRL